MGHWPRLNQTKHLPEIAVFTKNFAPNSVLLYDFKHPFAQHQPSPRRWSNNSFTMEVYPYLETWPPQTPCGAHVSHEKTQGNLWGHRLAVHKTWKLYDYRHGFQPTSFDTQVLELKYTGCKSMADNVEINRFFCVWQQWFHNETNKVPQELKELQVFATPRRPHSPPPKKNKKHTRLVL